MNNTTYGADIAREAAIYVHVMEILFGIIGTIGNTVVLIVILNTKKLRTMTNYLILNLAVADLLVSILLVANHYPINAYTLTVPAGEAGEAFCRFYYSAVLFWITIKASTFNLILVTFERYFAIIYPLSYHIFYTRNNVTVMVVISWSLAFLLEMVFVVFHRYNDGKCHLFVYPSSSVGVGLGIFNFLISYFIPIIVMVWAYGRILVNLRKRASDIAAGSSDINRARTLLQARTRVIRMLLMVLLAYAICWTPDSFLFLAHNTGAPISYTADYFKVVVLLAFANSCLNPFIYVFKYKQFRKVFFKCFCCCVARFQNKVEDASIAEPLSAVVNTKALIRAL
ncbi:cholecystokinin receptor-like [Saccoglossus kowalevskii]|uniref:Cholecystokinin receptor-like n=1 Tax=Saccoglossus kowalevskii TaxID=10224 RepID=A0ABM0LZ36_SACKO|nr:PREDICTED: cholecystokinin receptor-like [Saccoglossus kowalevskii]